MAKSSVDVEGVTTSDQGSTLDPTQADAESPSPTPVSLSCPTQSAKSLVHVAFPGTSTPRSFISTTLNAPDVFLLRPALTCRFHRPFHHPLHRHCRRQHRPSQALQPSGSRLHCFNLFVTRYRTLRYSMHSTRIPLPVCCSSPSLHVLLHFLRSP